jgi:branched-chain amino acid transport system substrate-binding protein
MGDPDLVANLTPDLLEGVMTVVANWSMRGQESIADEYKERSGEPWITQNPICAYAHLWILKEALEIAGTTDRRAIAEAIRNMDLTDGPADFFPGGRIRFDELGRRIDADLLVVQWQDGEPVTVFPESAAVAAPVWPSAR